jgi:putative ABC transport system permease protein
MHVIDAIGSAFSAIRANALRSVLTIIGIAIGIAAVIAMVAIGSGTREQVDRQVRALGANLFIIVPGNVTHRGARLGAGTASSLTDDDAAALRAEVDGVRAAAPLVNMRTQVVAGGVNWNTAINGIDQDWFPAREWDVETGRSFDPDELRRGETVAILGRTVAQKLFADQDPIGQSIRIREAPFRVIGVMAAKGQSVTGQDEDDIIFVPLDAGRRRVYGRNPANDRSVMLIFVKFERDEDTEPGVRDMNALLRQRHRLSDGQEDDFIVRNLTETVEATGAAGNTLGVLVAAVAGVSLLVGGIGIMNIMLVSVTERTREIGLRLAVGARPRDIRAQLLIEAVTISTLGGAIGIAVGIGAARAIATAAGWPSLISPDTILLAAGFSSVVGLFFGLYPAQRASLLDPIDALRRE